MAKALVVGGYYGFGNWGDEATLAVLIRSLRETFPHLPIVVLSHDPSATKQLHAVDAINRWNPMEIRQELRDALAFILGPGSLFQDASSTRSLLYYLGLLHWAHRLRKPVYLLGHGIGPLRSGRSELWVAGALRKAQLILLRDRASYEWACNQEIARDRLVLGEDLALLSDLSPRHPHPGTLQLHRSVLSAPSAHKGVSLKLALSLRAGLSPRNVQELCCTLKTLQKKFPIDRWVLLPFHQDRDEPILNTIAQVLGSNAVLVRASSPAHLLQALEGLDLLIGMRLHSLIFALLKGIPFFGLSYDPKIENFIQRMEEFVQYPLCWSRVGEDLVSVQLVKQLERILIEREELKLKLASARALLQARADVALREVLAQLTQNTESL